MFPLFTLSLASFGRPLLSHFFPSSPIWWPLYLFISIQFLLLSPISRQIGFFHFSFFFGVVRQPRYIICTYITSWQLKLPLLLLLFPKSGCKSLSITVVFMQSHVKGKTKAILPDLLFLLCNLGNCNLKQPRSLQWRHFHYSKSLSTSSFDRPKKHIVTPVNDSSEKRLVKRQLVPLRSQPLLCIHNVT